MSNIFLWIAFISALLDWAAVAANYKSIRYITKPSVITFLLFWLAVNNAISSSMLWFSIGLVFSLLGDIILVLPREPFIPALIAFLFAHISYIIGFNSPPPPINLPGIILALIVITTGIQIFLRLAKSMSSEVVRKLRIPILAYTLVISLMLLSALLTLVRPEPPSPGGWNAFHALLVSGGALLFFLSDTSLAWNKFAKHFPFANLIVMITYHLGQIGIILGAFLHYHI